VHGIGSINVGAGARHYLTLSLHAIAANCTLTAIIDEICVSLFEQFL